MDEGTTGAGVKGGGVGERIRVGHYLVGGEKEDRYISNDIVLVLANIDLGVAIAG